MPSCLARIFSVARRPETCATRTPSSSSDILRPDAMQRSYRSVNSANALHAIKALLKGVSEARQARGLRLPSIRFMRTALDSLFSFRPDVWLDSANRTPPRKQQHVDKVLATFKLGDIGLAHAQGFGHLRLRESGCHPKATHEVAQRLVFSVIKGNGHAPMVWPIQE
jgi:hypothetical protein